MFKRIRKKNESDSSRYHVVNTNMSEYEGQLAVDVYKVGEEIIIKAPIAGVGVNDVNVTITDDVVTIKGKRNLDNAIPAKDYFTQECYWGAFSRSIILPTNLDRDRVVAHFKDGILEIHIPQSSKVEEKKVQIEE